MALVMILYIISDTVPVVKDMTDITLTTSQTRLYSIRTSDCK